MGRGIASVGTPLPENAQYRFHRPGLGGRFADAYNAQSNLTQNLALMALGANPANVQRVRAAQLARRNQYLPRNIMESLATKAGGYAKQIIDPIGLGAAILTKTPASVLMSGGLYEGGTSVTDDLLTGKDIDYANATRAAASGAFGAYLGDKLLGHFAGDVVPEVLGRTAEGLMSEGGEDLTNAAIGSAEGAVLVKPKPAIQPKVRPMPELKAL